jgi:tetratricopeptide (TPR) repeat protein
MKKLLLFLIVVFLGYMTAFYTAGKENGYNDPFDFSHLERKLDAYMDFESSYSEETLTGDHFQNGLVLLEDEQYYDALDEFKEAVKQNDNAENNYWLGHAYLKTGDYMSANAYLTTAIEMDSEYAEAYRDRGITKYYQNYYDEAIEDLYTSTEHKIDDPKTYYFLSLCYETQSNYEVALQAAESALEYEKENIDYWFKAAYLAHILENYPLGLSYYHKVLQIDSTYRYALYNLGLIYSEKDNTDSAHYWYDKTIAHYPDYSLAYNNKGYLYQKKGNFEKAIDLYSTAIIYDPEDTRPVWNRGDCYMALKMYNEAIADYMKVYNLESNYYNSLFHIAECYDKMGDKKNALDYYVQYKKVATDESAYYEEVDNRIKNLN